MESRPGAAEAEGVLRRVAAAYAMTDAYADAGHRVETIAGGKEEQPRSVTATTSMRLVRGGMLFFESIERRRASRIWSTPAEPVIRELADRPADAAGDLCHGLVTATCGYTLPATLVASLLAPERFGGEPLEQLIADAGLEEIGEVDGVACHALRVGSRRHPARVLVDRETLRVRRVVAGPGLTRFFLASSPAEVRGCPRKPLRTAERSPSSAPARGVRVLPGAAAEGTRGWPRDPLAAASRPVAARGPA